MKSQKPWYITYGIALLSVFIIWSLRLLFHPILGSFAPLQPFLIAVMVSAWLGGFWPGFFSAVVGITAGCYFFLVPFNTLTLSKLNHAWIESLLIPEAILFSLLCSFLTKARSDAEQADKAKTFFLANISHEMRTPLTAISGFAELLTKQSQGTEVDDANQRKEWIQAIQRNSQLLSHIIQDILELSKVEAGAIQLERMQFNLPVLLRDVEEMLKERAKQQNTSIDVRYEGRVPSCVYSDPYRLKQVLINIIGNAIKFTVNGSVHVTVQSDEQSIRFLVEDSGTGISAEGQKKLFQPFSQVADQLSQNKSGTGLGLVLSRKLAHLLGGDVKLIKSAPNAGSTFCIEINNESVDAIATANPIPLTKADLNHFPRAVKILLADDVPDNRMLIGRILTNAGATVEFAENGLVATEKFKADIFDCCLVDLQMPVMDGYETTKAIRCGNTHVPIIALTAHGFEDERQKVLGAGFSGFLTKPISGSELIKTISNFL